MRATELWRVDPKYLEQAQDDATLLAIRDQERAGLDIITDGEARRESYSNRFATALAGVDIDNPGTALDRSGHPNPVPRVVGPVERMHPVQVRDVQFLRANTSRPIKVTVPGPFTMSQQAQNDSYDDRGGARPGYAGAVHDEIVDLFAAGADIVQIDEPYMQARPEKAREFGVAALNRALDGVVGDDRGAHLLRVCRDHPRAPVRRTRSCRSWPAAPSTRSRSRRRNRASTRRCSSAAGQDDHPRRDRPRRRDVESPEIVAERIRRALPYKRPTELVAAPDCGMKYLPRDVAVRQAGVARGGRRDGARRGLTRKA